MMRPCFSLSALLAVVALPAQAAPPKDLSADMVVLSDGRTMETSKIYVSGARSRMESSMMGGFTSIVRRDRGVVWMLYPARKQYTERPLDAKIAAQDPASEPPGLISKEKIGVDTVGGHPCTVYRMKVAAPGGRQLTTTACVSESLGLSLRSEVAGIVSELRNIRLGSQPANLFEIPSGFQLTTAPVRPSIQIPPNMPPALAEKMRRAAGGSDPGGYGTLPSWLPAMPGCTPRVSGNEQAGGVGMICQSAAQETANWYEAALKRNGFTVRQSSINTGRAPMVSLKATRGALEVAGNFSVNASGKNAGTLSWLTRK